MRQIGEDVSEIESEIGWDFRIGKKDSRDSIALVAVSCKASIIEFLRISLGVILKKFKAKTLYTNILLNFRFREFSMYFQCNCSSQILAPIKPDLLFLKSLEYPPTF